MINRRDFLVRTGWALGAAALAQASARAAAAPAAKGARGAPDWRSVRNDFNLDPEKIHLALFFLASHPRPVREAIERHRRGLDRNPHDYWFDPGLKAEADVLAAAASHLGVRAQDIALTDSTTMGLGLLYGGLVLRAGQEVVTTTHDHYSTEMALQHRVERTGAKIRRVALYRDPGRTTEEEIVRSLLEAIGPKTRYVALTWVHSSSGVKLPLRRIADELARVNAKRSEADRVLLCVDGVHGIGAEDVRLPDLGCDFFVAGAHKWLFGPRGTGFVWGHPRAWRLAQPIIPSFGKEPYLMWMKAMPRAPIPVATLMTPGGFHSFEHRWALADAFRYHAGLGKRAIQERIHGFATAMKDGLAKIRGVRLRTPRSTALSSGIVCFEMKGRKPEEIIQKLAAKRIVASTSPYAVTYARVAPNILTTPEEVDRTLREIRALA